LILIRAIANALYRIPGDSLPTDPLDPPSLPPPSPRVFDHRDPLIERIDGILSRNELGVGSSRGNSERSRSVRTEGKSGEREDASLSLVGATVPHDVSRRSSTRSGEGTVSPLRWCASTAISASAVRCRICTSSCHMRRGQGREAGAREERKKRETPNARRGEEGEEKESPYRLLPHRGTNGRVLAFPPAELLLLRPLRRFPHLAAGVGRLCDREIPHGRARWRSQGGLLRDLRSPPLSPGEVPYFASSVRLTSARTVLGFSTPSTTSHWPNLSPESW